MQLNISTLPGGIDVMLLPDQRFASVQIKLWYVIPLQMEQIASAALLPMLLKRGCVRWPSQQELAAALQRLWGAQVQMDVAKLGHAHVTVMELDLIDPRFLPPQASEIISSGIELLANLVQRPKLVGGEFPADVFHEEKHILRSNQERLKNHRAAYAMARCVEALFDGEAMGVHRLGRPEDLDRLTPRALTDYYEYFCRTAIPTIGITGAFNESLVQRDLAHAFMGDFDTETLPSLAPKPYVDQVRRQREELPGEQSQLVLAFCSEIAYQDELSVPLLLLNGLWGAFAHSRLFRKLREEAGLAYATWSRVDRSQGLIFTCAGISEESAPKAEEIMLQELESLQRGEIGAEELLMTRETLLDQLRQVADDPNATMEYCFSARLLESKRSLEETMEAIQHTTREQLVAAAQKVRLHTAYLLAGDKARVDDEF